MNFNFNKALVKNLIGKIGKKTFSIICVAVFLVLIFLIAYFYYLLSISSQKIVKLEKQILQLQEEINFLRGLPSPDVPAVELFEPGQVGEIEQEITQEVDDFPAMVFNTVAVVQEVQQDRVIVLGDGGNFADRKPRQLTLLFTLETNVFLADRTQYTGLAGLEQLQPGMRILVNSIENMRGRTEFRVLNINVLEF